MCKKFLNKINENNSIYKPNCSDYRAVGYS